MSEESIICIENYHLPDSCSSDKVQSQRIGQSGQDGGSSSLWLRFSKVTRSADPMGKAKTSSGHQARKHATFTFAYSAIGRKIVTVHAC